MRTALRLSSATLLALSVLVASHAVVHAEKLTRYNFKGEVIPEPTTAETIARMFPLENILAVMIAFALPGMPRSVCWPFAALALFAGWKFAICLCFGYYLLQYLMGGANSCE